jgi:hypothetical protein
VKIIVNGIKLFAAALVLNTVVSLAAVGQTVPVRQASTKAANSSGGIANKSEAATLNNNKVKMVDKKKRKATHVTTIKRPTDSAQNQKK